MLKILLVLLVATFTTAAIAGPLHDAARQGDFDAVREMIAEGADLDEKAQNGETPVILAVLGGHEEVARALIEAGADIHGRNAGGFTPLHAAAYAGELAMAQLLIERGADINDAQNKAGVTPLFPAIEEKHAAVAELLIAEGADLSWRERHGHTPVARAVFKDNGDMVRLLKAHGVDCPPLEELGDFFHPRCLEMGN